VRSAHGVEKIRKSDPPSSYKAGLCRGKMRKLEIKENADQFILKTIEQSDTTNPQSLRGVGPYVPYGPEAKIRNPKLLLKTDLTE
jgi:hypothetical protein